MIGQGRLVKPNLGLLDSLAVEEEWWLGGRMYGLLQSQFGQLTVQYVGGTAPGATRLSTPLTNGDGYGGGLQVVVEYRAPDRPWAFVAGLGAEYHYATATSEKFVSQGIYAYRARFEAVSSAFYLSPTFEVRHRIGSIGTFAMAGVQVDVPVSDNRAALWQHEELDGTPTGEPGYPTTSIRYGTTINYATRVGLTLGIGHDFMVGLYGYRSQLITPFASVVIGTPVTTTPTSWNGATFKLGVMWRTAL
jgi:hypothetical protein